MQAYPSKLVERAVEQLSTLPGIGRKTALRLALYMLKKEIHEIESFSMAIYDMRKNMIYCKECHNVSDTEICSICSNTSRDHKVICVVQSVSDVIAIENTSQYRGVYHILGGVISPIDGIGPQDLTISELIVRVDNNDIEEIILALGTTLEGDTTNNFIYRQLSDKKVKVTILSRGVAIGDEIEYADEITLGRSILNRTSFDNDNIGLL